MKYLFPRLFYWKLDRRTLTSELESAPGSFFEIVVFDWDLKPKIATISRMSCTHFKVHLPITDKHLLISNWTFVGQTQINHETIDVLTELIFPATCSYRHLQSHEKPGMNVDSCWMAWRLWRRAELSHTLCSVGPRPLLSGRRNLLSSE